MVVLYEGGFMMLEGATAAVSNNADEGVRGFMLPVITMLVWAVEFEPAAEVDNLLFLVWMMSPGGEIMPWRGCRACKTWTSSNWWADGENA